MQIVAVVALVLAASPAFAELRVESVRIVGRAHAAGSWTTAATEARIADQPELSVIVIARRGRKRFVVADPDLKPLLVDGRRIARSRRLAWSQLGAGVEVRWSQVEPHAWREPGESAPNGTATRFHSNVSTEPDSFGKWLGYDRITYFESLLTRWQGGKEARRRRATISPRDTSSPDHKGLGTMRFKVEVRRGDDVFTSPGAEAIDRYGILPSVHRVSIRKDDSVVGYISAYFLVPEVFGSAGGGKNHQTERFVGADCADVITGAARRAGFRKIWHTNVAGLTRYAKKLTGVVALDADGNAETPVQGVVRGDIIRINYGGALANHTPRSWDHVALLWEDRSDAKSEHKGGPNGQLDGFDLVVHMGHPRLEVEPLSGQAPALIDVLRWDVRRAGRPARPKAR